MKKLTLVIALAVLGIASCKKESTIKTEPTNVSVSNFNELKTSQSFDWKTTKEITINIAGLQTISPVIGTFTVTTTDGKIAFYQASTAMNQSNSIKVSVPSHIKDININFGSVQKTFSTSQSSIQFDYLMPVTGDN